MNEILLWNKKEIISTYLQNKNSEIMFPGINQNLWRAYHSFSIDLNASFHFYYMQNIMQDFDPN